MRTTLLLAASLLVAMANVAADELSPELDRLQGAWTVIGAERNGQPLADKDFAGDVITFDKAEMILDRKGSLRQFYKVKIDASAQPKRIDLVGVTGTDEGKTLRGVYRIEGDRLTLCAGLIERPTEFRTTPDAMQRLLTLQRRKQ